MGDPDCGLPWRHPGTDENSPIYLTVEVGVLSIILIDQYHSMIVVDLIEIKSVV